MGKTPVIVVHDKEHATAALHAAARHNISILLLSGRYAASTIGALMFKEIIVQAARSAPDSRFKAALDCGADAGRALAALRSELQMIVFDMQSPASERIADIAERYGAEVLDTSVYSQFHLDLLAVGDPVTACDSFLSGEVGSDDHKWRL